MTTPAGPPDEPCAAATARVYANAGWAVFPLWWPSGGVCACPAGAACPSPAKHPLTRRGVHAATGDPGILAAWWTRWPRANIGIATGASGLAVLDVDAGKGGIGSLARLLVDLAALGTPLPTTASVTTGGGGLHLYFAAPPAGIKGGADVLGPDSPGLDTRGRGGYVVAPPSVHASGRVYQWRDATRQGFLAELAPWPAALGELMRAHPEAP